MDNSNFVVHGITNLPNTSASEKLVMIHLYTLKSLNNGVSHVETSANQLSYTRHGYLKILKRLINKGYVKQIKRGYYELNETNLF